MTSVVQSDPLRPWLRVSHSELKDEGPDIVSALQIRRGMDRPSEQEPTVGPLPPRSSISYSKLAKYSRCPSAAAHRETKRPSHETKAESLHPRRTTARICGGLLSAIGRRNPTQKVLVEERGAAR